MIVVALVADHTFRFVVNVYHGDDTADLTYYNFGMSIVDGKMNVFHGLVIPHDTIQPILPSIFVGKGSQLVAPVTFFVFNVAIQDQDFMYNVITGFTSVHYPRLLEARLCMGAPNWDHYTGFGHCFASNRVYMKLEQNPLEQQTFFYTRQIRYSDSLVYMLQVSYNHLTHIKFQLMDLDQENEDMGEGTVQDNGDMQLDLN